MRIYFQMLAICLPLLATPPIAVETRIQSVRLHPTEAWITRTGIIQVSDPGIQRVTLAGLPAGLKFDDLRISAKGPSGTRLGDLSVREIPQTYKAGAEWKRLEAEQDHLKDSQELITRKIASHEKARRLFQELKANHAKAMQRAMSTENLKPQSVQEFSGFVESRALELARQKALLEEEAATLKTKAGLIATALNKLEQEGEANPTVVSAELEIPKPGRVEIALAFRAKDAAWTPAYESRLSQDRSRLELVLFAAVKQDTTEDWKDVELELVSQATSGGLDLPHLAGLPALSFKEGEAPKPTLMAPTPKASSGAISTLRVPGKVMVQSGELQRFRIKSLDLSPTFRYLAYPRNGSDVFLMALVIPPPGFPLVGDSPVDLLQGTDRLGTLKLEEPGPGEPLRLSYGPVPGLTARHTLLERNRGEVGEKTKDREWVFKESFAIESSLSALVEIELLDRTVVSGTDSVKVDQDTGTSPGWKNLRMGLRSWTLRLEAGDRREIVQQTRIRGPLVGHLAIVGDLSLEGN